MTYTKNDMDTLRDQVSDEWQTAMNWMIIGFFALGLLLGKFVI